MPRDRIASFDRLKGVIRRHYLWSKIRSRIGLRVAWVTSGAPVEILLPFGFYPVYPESHGALCAARKVSPELLEIAENEGYSADLCHYGTADIGHAMTGRSPIGGMPRPDVLLCCTNICGTVLKWYQALAEMYDVPLVVVDTPFIPDLPDGPREGVPSHAVDFVEEQLREAVTVLEGLTGRRYSAGKLRKVLDRSREAMELWKAVLATAEARPAPLTCFDAFILMNPIVTIRGTRACVAFYRKLLDEMRRRAAQGRGRIREERLRIVWDNIPVWYRMRELSKFLEERRACLVADTYTNAWAENEIPGGEPLRAMAEIYTGVFLNRGLRARADSLVRLSERFGADGAILHSNRSCKPYSFGQYDVLRIFEERTGKPGFILEADHVDPRHWDDARVMSGLETFMDSIG
jgi:benzoyl-CoA reductase/2-hydroxyglutaryl-CoA dehydratase subunit BcrC/BadD/HgdB